MSHDLADTIAAAASAPGGAARGVIRLSGPDVGACIAGLFRRRDDGADWRSAAQGVAVTGDLLLGRPFAPLPCDLYYWPNERSYTRQPAAELHTIGSPPLLDAALRAVCAAGARLAEPGEFTMRAFLAGRLDLTQAEAVLGAIDAADRRQFDVALAQLAGGMSRPLARLRDSLLDILAHLEAGLDFAEEDIQFISAAELDQRLGRAQGEVGRLAEQTRVRGETGEAFRVALVGWPNVGKSSLFNALAPGADALVCDVPGTTRDYLTARVPFDGVACELIDTAGVEPYCTGAADRAVATDRAADAPLDVSVAASAQEMTNYWRERADLQVLCLDATRSPNAWEQSQLAPPDFKDRLVAMTKCDRDARELPSSFTREWRTAAVRTSALTGAGVEALRRAIAEQSRASSHAESSVVAATAVRCHESLRLAAECLRHARQLASNVEGDELVAVEIHGALDELGKVAGAVFTDDILDRIFSRFCIGK